MTGSALVARLLVAAALAATPALGAVDAGSAAIDDDAAQHQILVMLRLPAPHYRPDASYTGSYDSRFGRDGRRRVADALATRFKLKIVDSWPMPALGVDCFVMEAGPDVAIPRLAEEIEKDASVESIQAMNLFRALGHADPLYPLQPAKTLWQLDDLHRLATGRNVRVAEIDSGVEADHPDLRGRIALTRNFVDGTEATAEAHGTAVAGIIAARADDGVGIVGIAPDAALFALRACWQRSGRDPAALCSSFTLAKALQFALDRGAQVINLSLGGPEDRLLGRLLDVAASRGTIVVAAYDVNRPEGGFPASHPSTLAVAADDAQDSAATLLFAPGRDLPATLPGGQWGVVSGSSFAAAEVSGLVALLLDIAPGQTLQQIRANLSVSDIAVSSPRHAIVDACAAVARVARACACRCAAAHSAAFRADP